MSSKTFDHGGAVLWLREVLATIRLSLCVLNRIQFDAPWRGRSSKTC